MSQPHTPRKRTRREKERSDNIASDTHIPSWGRVEIARPRSGAVRNTDLRFRISQIKGVPDIVGPVITLLLAVEALFQNVGGSTELARISSLDHAGLIDFRARFVEGDPRVVRAMREGPGVSLNLIRDAITFAEGLLLIDRCIETIKDDTLKLEVGPETIYFVPKLVPPLLLFHLFSDFDY